MDPFATVGHQNRYQTTMINHDKHWCTKIHAVFKVTLNPQRGENANRNLSNKPRNYPASITLHLPSMRGLIQILSATHG